MSQLLISFCVFPPQLLFMGSEIWAVLLFQSGGEREKEGERERWGWPCKTDDREKAEERERQWQYLWPTWVLLSLARWNAWRQQHIAPFHKTFRHTQTLTRAIMHMCTFPNMLGRMNIIYELKSSCWESTHRDGDEGNRANVVEDDCC